MCKTSHHWLWKQDVFSSACRECSWKFLPEIPESECDSYMDAQEEQSCKILSGSWEFSPISAQHKRDFPWAPCEIVISGVHGSTKEML